jgi:hypothetical protein
MSLETQCGGLQGQGYKMSMDASGVLGWRWNYGNRKIEKEISKTPEPQPPFFVINVEKPIQ